MGRLWNFLKGLKARYDTKRQANELLVQKLEELKQLAIDLEEHMRFRDEQEHEFNKQLMKAVVKSAVEKAENAMGVEVS